MEAAETGWCMLMQHIVVRSDSQYGGYWLDPGPYLQALPEIVGALPPGSRAHAEAPGHYDFYSGECVKDLKFAQLSVDGGGQHVVVEFDPSPTKHTAGLVITYTGVTSLSIERGRGNDIGWMGTLLLDEVLPVEGGVSHEVALTSGTITIVSSDFEVRWQ